MKDKTVHAWAQELASKDGKYGGGSAASVVGAYASSLAQFVFELQQGKDKYIENEDQIQEAIQKAENLTEELLDLAEIDADVFEPVIALFKLPQSTEEEKKYQREKSDEELTDDTKTKINIKKK